jgi:hypothetical protein
MKYRIDDPGLAGRIKKLVDIAGNSNRLSKASGLSITTIKSLLTGTADPTRTSLIALNKATGVSILWLATGEGSMYDSDTANERRSEYAVDRQSVNVPDEVRPVLDAFIEVMSSDEYGTKLALKQNVMEFRDKVRIMKEFGEMRSDLDAIKRRILDPIETDFKTQGRKRASTNREGGEN